MVHGTYWRRDKFADKEKYRIRRANLSIDLESLLVTWSAPSPVVKCCIVHRKMRKVVECFSLNVFITIRDKYFNSKTFRYEGLIFSKINSIIDCHHLYSKEFSERTSYIGIITLKVRPYHVNREKEFHYLKFQKFQESITFLHLSSIVFTLATLNSLQLVPATPQLICLLTINPTNN